VERTRASNVELRPTMAAERRRQRRGDISAMATSVSSGSAIGVVNLGERGDGGTLSYGGSGETTATARRR